MINITSPRYGDRYPISVPGRLIGIVSLLVGVVMDALFIAIMTSSLTVFVFDMAANPDRGKKVSEIFYFVCRVGTSVQGYRSGCFVSNFEKGIYSKVLKLSSAAHLAHNDILTSQLSLDITKAATL